MRVSSCHAGVIGLLVFVTWAMHLPAARAFDAAAKSEIEKLLDVGWQTSVRSRPDADAQYAQVVQAGGGFEGEYGYFLVLLHQRRYSEASKQAESLVKHHPDSIIAWRASMWLAVLTKNYQGALADSAKFAELLSSAADKPEQGTVVRDNLEFLGRIYGFLGGPAGEKVKQEERKAAEKSIVEQLPADLRPAFEESRDAVIEQFLVLANQKADERDKALQSAEEEKQQTLADVEKQRERIEERKDEIKEDVDRAKEEIKAELDELQKEDAPLQTQLARLQINFAQVEGVLNGQINQIALLSQQLRNEKNPFRRDQLRQDIQFVELQAARTRADLAGIDQQAAAVQQQRAVIAAKAAAAQQQYNTQLGLANKAASDLKKEDQRADTIERMTKRPAVGNTTRVTALNAQASALTTYQPFPLEQEKQRLLDSLK